MLAVKTLPASAADIRDEDSTLGSGRHPGGGHGNPFQYPCPESPMDRGAWRAAVHEAAESDVTGHASACTRVHAHAGAQTHSPEEFKFCFHSKNSFFKKCVKEKVKKKTRYLFLQIQVNFKKFFLDYLWDKNLLRRLLSLVGEALPILSLKWVFSVKMMDEFSLKVAIYLN